MPTSFAGQSDVEAKLIRPCTTAEATYVPSLLAEASALLRNIAPSIDSRIAAFAASSVDPRGIDPAVVAGVIAGIVKDYLVNPAGVASQTEATGPFSHSNSFALRGDKSVRGVLKITPDHLEVIFPTRKRPRAGTIRLRPSLAPRPVGRYGPIPTAASALDAAITYSGNYVPDEPVVIGVWGDGEALP